MGPKKNIINIWAPGVRLGLRSNEILRNWVWPELLYISGQNLMLLEPREGTCNTQLL